MKWPWLVYALILTVAIPVGMTFSSSMVNREIQELSKDEIQKAQTERDKAITKCNGEIGRFQNIYSQRIDKIKNSLEPLKEFEDIYKQCLFEVKNCQAIFDELQKKSHAAADLADWLSSKSNRMQIRDFAVFEVEKKHSIPAYKAITFRNDIGRCINWLRDSIFALQGYEVRREEIARACPDIPSGISAYLTALEVIKSHSDLVRLSNNTNVLEDFIQELSKKIQP